jgi:hypothetical protein
MRRSKSPRSPAVQNPTVPFCVNFVSQDAGTAGMSRIIGFYNVQLTDYERNARVESPTRTSINKSLCGCCSESKADSSAALRNDKKVGCTST